MGYAGVWRQEYLQFVKSRPGPRLRLPRPESRGSGQGHSNLIHTYSSTDQYIECEARPTAHPSLKKVIKSSGLGKKKVFCRGISVAEWKKTGIRRSEQASAELHKT